ncbi:penicillin-binding protein 1C [Pseudohoeflea suaedae]|uniref:peptidoglycan glycosyltransferase n=2 Tax=Pseudohoeflea suaedae TaxID=877384 RepID=A0A4R5PL36_9HYPH|nr:penicillin-binding protein 1C [Pseudohoeflea suaedae]TDH36386.1 penicillin-binding protein 1C [Pseudohoeflea suaedae]
MPASRRARWLAGACLGLAGCAALTGAALWADKAYPPPLDVTAGLSRQVLDRDGRLLRAYAARDGRWRLPVTLDQVDSDYLDMLIAYEDKRFYSHHGIDPLAVARAAWQFVAHGGRIVSGGSTLTMQVARLIEPRAERSLTAKLRQAARAIQIERRLSKREILELYLTLAPYGGNLEGVRAASLAWFGREPKKLTLSQSALLVALPQSPETRRPDRHVETAYVARDRVLGRMRAAGLLPDFEVERAGRAKLSAVRKALPDLAPHLADRALDADPLADSVTLTLNADLQQRLEQLAAEQGHRLGRRQSLAMVLADARSGHILASVGSTGFLDSDRFGAIDMTIARRSPGSTLKPFIYGLAFEEALVEPATLIDDAPANFAGYRPRNFDLAYQGEVSIREALQLSLNVPAVRLLDAVSPVRLIGRLKRGGVALDMPEGGAPGLAIGLGGVGISLRDLVQLYTAFPNDGQAVALTDGLGEPAPLDAPILSRNAAWQTADILSGVAAPADAPRLKIAYKTGTSYGYRDAWSVGFDGRHVLGVWVGRADAAPSPGISGIGTAAPILFEAFARAGLAPARLPPRPSGLVVRNRNDLPHALRKFGGEAIFAEHATGPEIVFPPAGARVDLDAGQGRRQPLVLKLQGGSPPYRWIANGVPLKSTTRRPNLAWRPDGPGASNLTVIDANGQAASVSVFIE